MLNCSLKIIPIGCRSDLKKVSLTLTTSPTLKGLSIFSEVMIYFTQVCEKYEMNYTTL